MLLSFFLLLSLSIRCEVSCTKKFGQENDGMAKNAFNSTKVDKSANVCLNGRDGMNGINGRDGRDGPPGQDGECLKSWKECSWYDIKDARVSGTIVTCAFKKKRSFTQLKVTVSTNVHVPHLSGSRWYVTFR
ncbi:collagen triple helix repeat-containing protein 1-like [Clytia hemisphaerica]|uniref:collagen triple helix repeat-containing protein 1-like n=1 Tax=Clytia hemisphaerica TaxID=252671 RepID=UPI0034D4C0F5